MAHAMQAVGEKEGVFELRKYTIKAESFPAFLELTAENMHLRTAYSPLLGYWSVEFGDTINSVVHLWHYESLNARAAVRAALVKDTAWGQGYMAKMRPMLVAQDAVIIKPSDNVPFKANDLGIYELRVGRNVRTDNEIMRGSVVHGSAADVSIGGLDKFPSAKDSKPLEDGSTSLIMLPVSFSPMQ